MLLSRVRKVVRSEAAEVRCWVKEDKKKKL